MDPWERCTSGPSEIRLPCGETIAVNRGAGQGEPDGPLKAAICIGRVVQKARVIIPECSFVDVWFIDDGQVWCRPCDVDKVLQALDAEFQVIGATRGSLSQGADIKSNVKAWGTHDDN